MSEAAQPPSKLAENPFYVLGVAVDATRGEIEREGQKLLAMLELGLARAQSYDTPIGPRPRTHEMVRAALAQLRDPQQRLLHEMWARLPPVTLEPGASERAAAQDERAAPFAALGAFGWRRR